MGTAGSGRTAVSYGCGSGGTDASEDTGSGMRDGIVDRFVEAGFSGERVARERSRGGFVLRDGCR